MCYLILLLTVNHIMCINSASILFYSDIWNMLRSVSFKFYEFNHFSWNLALYYLFILVLLDQIVYLCLTACFVVWRCGVPGAVILEFSVYLLEGCHIYLSAWNSLWPLLELWGPGFLISVPGPKKHTPLQILLLISIISSYKFQQNYNASLKL